MLKLVYSQTAGKSDGAIVGSSPRNIFITVPIRQTGPLFGWAGEGFK